MNRISVTLCFITLLLIPTFMMAQQPPINRDPVLNFEYAWKVIDRSYAQFESKQVDWNLLYQVYKPQITAETSDEKLWDILLTMLGHLNDAHVCLADGTRRSCGGQNENPSPQGFSLDLVKSKYLQGESQEGLRGRFLAGWLSDGVGYLYMADLKAPPEPTAQALDSLLQTFTTAKALVIDVRNNPGGTSRSVELAINRFADRKRHYLTVQTRYGPKHSDLWPPETRCLEPEGPFQFTRPTILLTNRNSASGPEIFALGMRVLPHVTIIGDLTEGAISSQFPDRMPNGWTLWTSFKLVRDQNGVCWDGLGLAPDLRICNSPQDLEAGRDRILEFALQLVQQGPPPLHDETAGLASVKNSLVDHYQKWVREKGLESAVRELKRLRAARDDSYFFSPDEVMQQANQSLGQKQYAEAIGLLEVCLQEYPNISSGYFMLAQAYMGLDNIDQAARTIRQGVQLEPMFYHETILKDRVVLALRKRTQGTAASLLGKALSQGGIPAAEKALETMLPQQKDGPVFDEADFNNLGYQLLENKQTELSLYVFKKTTQLFPSSWNAFDSLGEAHSKVGQNKEAQVALRRSIEINPGNRHGQELLKKLEAEK